MIIPEIFKYNSLISIPLFLIISWLLARELPDFSFSEQTISKSILFFKNPADRIIFKLNFIIKSLLDFGFFLYIVDRYNLTFYSSLTWFFFLSILFFLVLAYFIEGKFSVIHKVLIYGIGVFWTVCEVLLAQMTNVPVFILFTNISTVIVMLLAFGSLFTNKTNVFVQIACVSIMYLWIGIFVYKFL